MLIGVLSQQLFRVVADLLADVRVADVEVVVARDDVIDADFPGLLGLDAGFEVVFLGAPPVDFGLKFLEAHRLGLVVAGDAFRVGVLVEPDFFGGGLLALGLLGEEENVCLDAGVGREDAVGQADDGVEVALSEERFFEAGLHAFAEEEAIGQDHSCTTVVFQQFDDERHEEVGGLAGAEVGGEVVFDAVFFGAAEGRVGDDDVDAVFVAVVLVGAASNQSTKRFEAALSGLAIDFAFKPGALPQARLKPARWASCYRKPSLKPCHSCLPRTIHSLENHNQDMPLPLR